MHHITYWINYTNDSKFPKIIEWFISYTSRPYYQKEIPTSHSAIPPGNPNFSLSDSTWKSQLLTQRFHLEIPTSHSAIPPGNPNFSLSDSTWKNIEVWMKSTILKYLLNGHIPQIFLILRPKALPVFSEFLYRGLHQRCFVACRLMVTTGYLYWLFRWHDHAWSYILRRTNWKIRRFHNITENFWCALYINRLASL